MKRRTWHTIRSIAVLALAALTIGCGDGDGGGADPGPPLTLVEQGWQSFQSGDFAAAASRFQAAIAEKPTDSAAHNGLGWSSMGLGLLDDAMDSFDAALDNNFDGADPHVGKAIILRDAIPADYPAAITEANMALSLDAEFVFAYDPELDWRDVRLILAQSHFALGEYTDANSQVNLLGGNVQDPQSSTFVEDLLQEIQRLGALIGS